MSDLTQEPGLTERLAAKLEAEGFVQFDAVLIGHKAHTVLPLLLSEPELVAGLAPEVKREVLRVLLGERCGDCEGEGFTVDTFLDCCGHPDREGLCCGDAVPRQHQIGCERCQTTGFLAPSPAPEVQP